MSKSKFKIGDKVKVVKITGSGEKAEYLGKTFKIDRDYGYGDRYRYGLKDLDGYDNGWGYAEEELELVKEDGTYTGIELLQAIKDGVFKDGDRFEVSRGGMVVDQVKISKSYYDLRIKSGRFGECNLSLGDMLKYEFKPIKKEPINLAKVDKVLDVEIPVTILGKREFADVKVTIKGNKIVVKLPSGITGVASCCPEDEFDQDKGIKLAFTRAIKKQVVSDLDKNIENLAK